MCLYFVCSAKMKRNKVGSATHPLYRNCPKERTGGGVNGRRGNAGELTKAERTPQQTEQLVGDFCATGTRTMHRS